MSGTLLIDQYEQQLAEKVDRLRQMMLAFQVPNLQIFRSEPIHYRMRAEFHIWHDGDDLYHIMFDQQTKERMRIDYFMPGSLLINALMTEMMATIRLEPLLRAKLFQIDYLTSQSDQAIVTLIYHRLLDDAWRECAIRLRDALHARKYQIQLIGRANKTKICLDRDYVDERLTVAGRTLIYRQIENSFTQPNAGINVHMLEWVLAATKGIQGDLLELYCGNGNFSLVLARHFDRVLAVEIAKPSVEAARYNIAANHVNNVKIVRMSSKEFTQAMRREREFNRLKDIDIHSYRFKTIFVDPPRSGLDDATVGMVQAYPHILYISCNPDSLCRDLSILSTTHTIERLALFDQFPYTRHMECGVLLVRKPSGWHQ
ncbi:MAG: tRNA (uridine(54)-C5)-methyltransferase TrmA [Candidatus Liberibacter asiaticus]|nr:tRNA (uridine(54)-C5)-methyltransferase TrmA [Candidatus Liberibacter asiaticus]